jgi:hypothetical protein
LQRPSASVVPRPMACQASPSSLGEGFDVGGGRPRAVSRMCVESPIAECRAYLSRVLQRMLGCKSRLSGSSTAHHERLWEEMTDVWALRWMEPAICGGGAG